ncbi:TPA: fimbria/pilus periplasmic chaperone, partial [Salmonella enterica subsp. enterica serovar Birkenhead]|nr:chaperone protein AfaB [Salmonella enterica]
KLNFRKEKSSLLLIAIISLTELFSADVLANNTVSNINTVTQHFSAKLGASRVIYNLGGAGQTLTVFNPEKYPILVQSRVFDEERKNKAPFIVTPPLFRLDSYQQTGISIVRTGGVFPEDRETLEWLCVKGIPPKESTNDGDSGSEENKPTLKLKLSIDNCIKLLVRPKGINKFSDEDGSSVLWYKQGDKLRGENKTPFYINFAELKVGSVNIPDIHYIPPFSSYVYDIPKGVSGKVSWSVLNDYGAVSKIYEADVK